MSATLPENFAVNFGQLIQKALEDHLSSSEVDIETLKAHIESWLRSGVNGTLNGKPWSPRYKEIQQSYFWRYLHLIPPELRSRAMSIQALRYALGAYGAENFTTKNCIYCAWMSMAKYLILEGLLPYNRRDEAKQFKPKRLYPPKRIKVTQEQVEKLLFAISLNNRIHWFDIIVYTTIIELGDNTGARREECLNVRVSDLDLEKKELFIPKTKGFYQYTVGLNKKAVVSIERLIEARKKLGIADDHLFTLSSGKKLPGDTLSQVIRRHAKRANIGEFNFHALRRKYITTMLEAGHSLTDVSLAANHKSTKMTEQYHLPSAQRVVDMQKEWE